MILVVYPVEQSIENQTAQEGLPSVSLIRASLAGRWKLLWKYRCWRFASCALAISLKPPFCSNALSQLCTQQLERQEKSCSCGCILTDLATRTKDVEMSKTGRIFFLKNKNLVKYLSIKISALAFFHHRPLSLLQPTTTSSSCARYASFPVNDKRTWKGHYI